jgi:hypothetical protein
MKIVIVPSTLRGGAKRCLTVAREANASALRVGGYPIPEGMPAAATGQLRRGRQPPRGAVDPGRRARAPDRDARRLTNAEVRHCEEDRYEGDELTLVESPTQGLWLMHQDGVEGSVLLQPIAPETGREAVGALARGEW